MCETELPFLKSLNRKSPLCLLMSSSGCMPCKGGGGGGFLCNLVFIRLMACISFDIANPILDQQVYWLNQYIADSL